ncbi:MAG: cation diffusion facilitator family transporter [Candidatus Bathyarchaeota archaeon]|jgi:cation diffusion facilitator family transporter|nr:cation transporter [Candidatus Bathyarchaeota archaeon A05DMB-5]MDH7557014.1 cation diffusion facilitator family transporter [Candidatus Bathyarchaeota archaeon]
MTEYATETRGIKIALASYLILVIIQLTAYLFTNVLVLLAQALEMLSDVLVSTFLLISTYWSHKPADEFHMFGHGRGQNVAALVSATILISFMSLETYREAIPKFFQTSEYSEFQNLTLALTVIVVGMFIIAIPTVDILRTKAKGASMKAQLIALLKDEFSYMAALIAVILVGQGYHLADPAASIIVATVIALSGIYLFKDNVHYLVGKALGRQFLEKIESTAKSVKGVLDVHDLKAEYVGPNIIHTGFHIEVARGTSIEEADRIAEEVKEKISRETGCQHCVIHVDPAEN